MDILKFKSLIFLCLITLYFFAGCASATHVRVSDYVTEAQTNPKRVEVFFQTAPRKVRPIAIVAVARRGENSTYAVEMLKEEAATLGADAIVNLDMNYTTGMFPQLHVSGLAVKYE